MGVILHNAAALASEDPKLFDIGLPHLLISGRDIVTIDNLFDRIPQWLKSLHEMENELRDAARKGLILRKDEATEHLAQARRHLEGALREAKGEEPPDGPETPLRKEGEV